MSAYPTDQLLSLADTEAKKAGVDPATVRALLLSENSYFDRGGNLISKSQIDTNTVSPKNAAGIMQVIPSTAANLQRMGYFSGDPNTPEGQIRLGVAAVKEMNDRGITDPNEVAVAYNGGGSSLDAFRNGRTMNGETTTYLKKFTQHMTGTAPMDTVPTATAPANTVTSTREGYSTSKRELDPATKQYIDGRIVNANALASDTITQVQALTKGILSNSDAESQAIDAAAKANVDKTDAEATVKTATLDNQESILDAFGIRLNNPDNIVAERMATIRANANERSQLSNQIGALESTSPLTDPIGWIMNQVKQYPLIQRHNALVQQSIGAAKDIELAQQLASNQERIQPAHIQDAINNERLATVNQQLAGAALEKAKLLGAAKAKVAQLLIDTDHVNQTNLAQNIAWADAGATRTSESFSSSARDKEEQDLFGGINAAAAAWGLPPFNKLTFKTLDKETQDKWVKMAQFGRAGISPGDAVSLLYNTYGGTGLAKMNENAPIAGKFMQEIVTQGQNELTALQAQAVGNPKIANQLKGLKTPIDQLAFGIDSWAKKKEDELKTKDMGSVGVDNPYRVQPAYVSTLAELKDNPLSQLIAEKKVQGIRVDDQLLLSSALADVTSGKRSLGDVAQYVQEFYKKGSDLQRRDSAATLAGFHPLESYPVSMRLNTMGKNSVDLFNQQSIEQFLTMQAAAGKALQVVGDSPFANASIGARTPR